MVKYKLKKYGKCKAKNLYIDDHFEISGKVYRICSMMRDHKNDVEINAQPVAGKHGQTITLTMSPSDKLKIYNQTA